MVNDAGERRAVANALRGDPAITSIEQKRDGFDGMTYHEAAWRFWDMCRRVKSASDVDIANSTTSVLADIIDPLCHVTGVIHYGQDECCEDDIYEYELSCGHTIQSPFCEPPAYCPHCGARCIEGCDES